MRASVRLLLPLALVVAFTGRATAEDKAKIAILGIEVVGSIDIDSTTTARNVTSGLRAQVRTNKRFMLAPNSAKELIDEKVATGCETELADCMSKIGKKLGAPWLLYGKIEKKAKDAAPGYQLTLRLLDVEKKSATPWSEWIPLADTGGSELDTWSAKGFNSVTGTEDIAIVVPDPVRPKPAKSNGWRTTAYISGAAAVVFTGIHVYAWRQLSPTDGGKKCFDDANGEFIAPTPADLVDDCEAGKRNKILTWTAGPLALAAGGLAIYATYKGFISKRESSTGTAGKSTRKRSRFAVTPVISPDGAGATVQFDW